ncbi:MAG TPA: efflux RND transporter periplasmic adaptor subunit [Casimicrobiaceae bacterium]
MTAARRLVQRGIVAVSQPARRRLVAIVATFFAAVAIATLAVSTFPAAGARAGQGAPGANAAQVSPVPVATVAYGDVERRAIAEGVVEAVRSSTLGAQVAGRVIALGVKAGDTVKAGEVLVRIDPRSAAQAEAASRSQVREAQANLANARMAYERSEKLAAEKFISRAALDQARAQYLATQAQTAAAIANAQVSATSTSYTTIVAPYDGVVASTEVEVGDMATPGRPLVALFDPKALRVTATLAQAVLARADLGAAAIAIEIPSLSRSLAPTHVTVIPVADVNTHTSQVRLDLPESAGLMPGQYARAGFVIGRVRALVVPEAAVLRRGEVTAVYVIGANGLAQLRQVRLGESAGGGMVEVVAGLEAGERVSLEPVRSGIEASSPAARS